MNNKLSVQCQGGTNRALEYNALVLPTAIKAINASSADFWSRAKGANPRVLGVLRHYPDIITSWESAPEAAAVKWVDTFADTYGHLLGNGLVDVIEDGNEWIHSFECDKLDPADRRMARTIDEVHVRWKGKVHVAALNAAAGHFSDISWQHCRNDIGVFWRTLSRLNECPRCFLATHEYEWPGMRRLYDEGLIKGDGGMWLILKFLRIQRKLDELGYGNIQQAVTECGLTHAVQGGPDVGWKTLHPDISEARRMYLRDLRWLYDAAMRHPRLKVIFLYGYGMDGDWDTFNLDAQIVNEIARFQLYPEVR